jgi:hypothetical protein
LLRSSKLQVNDKVAEQQPIIGRLKVQMEISIPDVHLSVSRRPFSQAKHRYGIV